MPTATDLDRALSALAFLTKTLRPDWDHAGVTRVLDDLHRDRQPLGVIAKAAIAAALTPTTKTPAGIPARIAGGWTGDEHVQGATPTPPTAQELRCRRCGMVNTEGSDHTCAATGDHAAGAARARAAIRPLGARPQGSPEIS